MGIFLAQTWNWPPLALVRLSGAFAMFLLSCTGALSAESGYGQYGPYDYYDPMSAPKGALALVESEHFGPKTRNFARQGMWCAYWNDLDYTLRAFPNHPWALVEMADFLEYHQGCGPKKRDNKSVYDLLTEIEEGKWKERNADYYFEAGIKFRPQYAKTHMLYGEYLHKHGKLAESLERYKQAEKLDPKSAELHKRMSLLYLDKGAKDMAEHHAELAYRHGEKSPELKNKLIKAGAWNTK